MDIHFGYQEIKKYISMVLNDDIKYKENNQQKEPQLIKVPETNKDVKIISAR